MYAVSLGNGQSITIGNTSYGQTAKTYTGGATPVIVILNSQQYHLLPNNSSGTVFTDVSVFDQNMLSIPIPTATGSFVVGRFTYLGYSISATAATAITFQDTMGSYNGSTYSPQTLDEIAVAAGQSLTQYYPYSLTMNNKESGGISVIGELSLSAVSGTFSGIVRIGTR